MLHSALVWEVSILVWLQCPKNLVDSQASDSHIQRATDWDERKYFHVTERNQIVGGEASDNVSCGWSSLTAPSGMLLKFQKLLEAFRTLRQTALLVAYTLG